MTIVTDEVTSTLAWRCQIVITVTAGASNVQTLGGRAIVAEVDGAGLTPRHDVYDAGKWGALHGIYRQVVVFLRSGVRVGLSLP